MLESFFNNVAGLRLSPILTEYLWWLLLRSNKRNSIKSIMILCKKDVIQAARAFQLSAGQDVDAEVAIRTIREFYGNKNTGTILQNY